MIDKVSCYPPDWVYKVLGRSSTALNNALVNYSTALLIAIEENEREFTDPAFWEEASCLRCLSMNVDHGSPDLPVQITARLEEDLPIFALEPRPVLARFQGWIAAARKLSHIRALALLAVVDAVNMTEDLAGAWWTKENFLVRKGILQKSS